jgi:hypothetical protein
LRASPLILGRIVSGGCGRGDAAVRQAARSRASLGDFGHPEGVPRCNRATGCADCAWASRRSGRAPALPDDGVLAKWYALRDRRRASHADARLPRSVHPHPHAGGRGGGRRAARARTGRRHRPQESAKSIGVSFGAPERAGHRDDQGRRDRAIIAVLLGCALSRPAVAALTDGRWAGGFTLEATVAARQADAPEPTRSTLRR